MTRFAGWAVSAGLVLAAAAAHAQMLAPYRAISDLDGPYERPYGAVPPAPPPVYDDGAYGGAPALLPPQEVYAILRDNGFSPLGVPHQRGLIYTIAVIDRSGEDGRLVIDARNGRIIRFVPAYGYGPYGQHPHEDRYDEGPYDQGPYGPNSYRRGPYGQAPYDNGFPPERMSAEEPQGVLPPPIVIRGVPRPPAPIPHVASRAVPRPAPKLPVAGALPDPTPRPSAAASARSAPPPVAQATVAPQGSAATIGETKPAPVIRPTQDMPKVQDLE